MTPIHPEALRGNAKNGFLKHLQTQTSRKFKVALALGALLFMAAAMVTQITQQRNAAEQTFENNITRLMQEQTSEAKRAETLLNALSQFYAADLVKSDVVFEQFAQGLVDKITRIKAIGLAQILPKEHSYLFENEQKSLGYEDFTIEAKHLFLQETPNPTEQHLSINLIAPLTPEHSIYLGHDLLSLANVRFKLPQAVKKNQYFTETLQLTVRPNAQSSQHEIISLFLKPVYLSNPKQLSSSERQRQIKGAAFMIIPTEKILLEFVNQHCKAQKMRIDASFKSETQTFNKTILNTLPDQPFELPGLNHVFTSTFALNLSNLNALPSTQLHVTHYWPLSELRLWPMVFSALLALLFYSVLTLTLWLVIRYTKTLQQAQNRLSQIIHTSQDAVIVTNRQGYVQEWNPEATRLFGYSQDAALGQCIVYLIFENPDNLAPSNRQNETILIDIFSDNLNLKRQQGETNRIEVTLRTQSGQRLTAEVATAILSVQDDLEISLFIKDMTYQRRTEAEIKQLAYYDPLTKLENRTHFKHQVEQIITQKRFEKFALLFLDLDGFKQVNDTLGHSVGDELLVVIAKRITHTLRNAERDTHICRFGGDEFVLMLGHVTEENAAQISLRLLAQIERLVTVKDDDLHVSASIGIALYPQHGQDVDTLLRHADTAMYQSKASGKNTYSLYNDAMEQDLSKRTQLEKHLRHAITNQEFSLVYQPQINLKTGLVVGVEALIRWNNPTLGHVPPDEFISIAEESNQIIAIGNWVAQTCINQLSDWKNTQFDHLHIALNVSGVQFEHPYFLDTIRVMMNQANISRHLLEIELTERTIMGNVTENIARFNNIRAEGFGLSVDDFGTGYSSLSYLKKFPLSVLKIDKSFIDGLPDDEEDVSIASAIISLAHSLNMLVVAEGVETLGQLDFLKQLNCNKAQGYFISRPLTIDRLEPWLQAHKNGFFTQETVDEAPTQKDI